MEYGDVFVTADAGPALWTQSTEVVGTRVLSLVASYASRRVGVVTEGVRAVPGGGDDGSCVRWIREPAVRTARLPFTYPTPRPYITALSGAVDLMRDSVHCVLFFYHL
jgi:hypothetical protein